MNVAIMKTKVEQALTEYFASVAAKLPGEGAVAKARKAAIGRFGALGLPHRRIEEWKYTDLRNMLKEALPLAVGDATKVTAAGLKAALGPLARLDAHRVVFVNGAFRKGLSDLDDAGAVEVSSLGEVVSRGETVGAGLDGRNGDAVLALNTAYMTDGAVVRVKDKAKLEKPLLLVFLRAGRQPQFVATRNVIRVGSGAEATIIEAFVASPGDAGEGQANTATELVAETGASISHVKFVQDAGRAVHLANWMVDLGAKSAYRGFQFTSGTGLARNQIFVTFRGAGANLDLSGAFLARAAEHIDTTLVVDHAVPGCTSRELFKGVLDDHARGIFQGKIIVRPDAQKTDGKQMAQALMLSEDAEFDSKPELEIFADDVVCGHGSTAAEIDQDMLFYFKSRGIPEKDARALLVESFIGEAIDKIENETLREALMACARNWLGAGRAVSGRSS